MQTDHQRWAIKLIQEKLDRRNGQFVPAGFDLDTTRMTFSQIRFIFCKRRDISLRIKASKAQTLTELKTILENAQPTL